MARQLPQLDTCQIVVIIRKLKAHLSIKPMIFKILTSQFSKVLTILISKMMISISQKVELVTTRKSKNLTKKQTMTKNKWSTFLITWDKCSSTFQKTIHNTCQMTNSNISCKITKETSTSLIFKMTKTNLRMRNLITRNSTIQSL